MKNKVLTILLCCILLAIMFIVTGCGEKSDNNGNAEEQSQSKGKYDVFRCMEKLDATMTL